MSDHINAQKIYTAIRPWCDPRFEDEIKRKITSVLTRPDVWEDNADLVAAAAQMLEALKAIVDDMSHFPEVSESIFHSLNLADLAIARAEGESK